MPSTNDPGILLETKLHPPRSHAGHIERPQLVALLNRMPNRRVTLLSAPAGYGKTTIAVEWLQDRQDIVAWLSLGEHDDDLHLFARYLLAAINRVYPDACVQTRTMLDGSQKLPVLHLAATFVNELAQLPHNDRRPSLYLVIDDYHQIREPDIHQFLTILLGHQPHQLHIVLITRADPVQLPIIRLRAQHQLAELRQADLRFDRTETTSYLNQALGIRADEHLAETLDQSLEGWIAGLRLTTLSMSARSDPATLVDSIRGKNRYVAAYLMDEVLKNQPREVQDFLLNTSIFDRLCGALCEEVSGIDVSVRSGQGTLEWMDRINLFVVSLDDFGEWYRYHHLFKDFLLGKLHRERPAGEVSALHGRAARWFAAHGFVDEAMHHALLADDMATAVQLVEDNCQNMLNGLERHMLERWLSRLPQEVVWQRPKLLVANAWLLYRQGRFAEMGSILDRAKTCLEQAREHSDATSEDNALWGQLNALRSSVAFAVDDFSGALDSAELALEQIDADPDSSGIALLFGAVAQQMLGDKRGAQARVERVLDDPKPSGPAKTQSLICLSFLHLAAGELPQLALTAQRFLAHAKTTGNANAIVASNWVAGLLRYEWNELAEAHTHLRTAGERRFESNYLASVNCMLGLARVLDLQGEVSEAEAVLASLLEETAELHRGLLSIVSACQADHLWRQGETSEALRWARSGYPVDAVESVSLFECPSLIRARILVVHGSDAELRGVASDLDQRLHRAFENHFTQRVIKILAHRAMVHRRLGEHDDARNLSLRALALAQPGGFVRTFLDCGPVFHTLLDELDESRQEDRYAALIHGVFHVVGEARPKPSGANPAQQLLTAREEEILTLMSANLTNQEIAARLVISLFTVKRHASNIYRKLDVANRRQAIRRGEDLGILVK